MALASQILLVLSVLALAALGPLVSQSFSHRSAKVTAAEVQEGASFLAWHQISQANQRSLQANYPVKLKHDWRGAGEFEAARQQHYEQLVWQVLSWLPAEHAQVVKEITMLYDPLAARGLGGGSKIFLRAARVADEEFMAVLMHELGHVVDTGWLKGSWTQGQSGFWDGPLPVYQDDLSAGFYHVSWQDERALLQDSAVLDFVSGYSQTDPFEDFAESYAYYVLQGKNFRFLAATNQKLQLKYAHLRDNIFA